MATIFSTATLLFLVMDPLGNIPLFMTALKDIETDRRRRIVLVRELLIALTIMVLFLFAGGGILKALHVTESALNAAGGVVLMLIAVKMIFPTPESSLKEHVYDEPFIVPLAVPYVAGPSLLAMEMVLINQRPDKWHYILLSLVSAWLVSSIILYFSAVLQRYLGRKFLLAVERLMGMILVIIAMQMMMTGIKMFFFANGITS